MVATKAQVVARSPDLATRPTEGLPSRLPPGDLRSRSRRGLETRAEPSSRNREVIPGPFLRSPNTMKKPPHRAFGHPLPAGARVRTPGPPHTAANREEVVALAPVGRGM